MKIFIEVEGVDKEYKEKIVFLNEICVFLEYKRLQKKLVFR